MAGVSTLDALLHQRRAEAVAVIDARRREVFAAGPGLPAAAYAPAALASRLPAGTVVRRRRRAALRRAAGGGRRVPPTTTRCTSLRADAHAALARFDGTRPEPRYLREPDAEPEAA